MRATPRQRYARYATTDIYGASRKIRASRRYARGKMRARAQVTPRHAVRVNGARAAPLYARASALRCRRDAA